MSSTTASLNTSTIKATTTSTTTTTTTTTTATTTDNENNDELEPAAAVHEMRQLDTSSDEKKVVSLDVGAPEIGECPRSL